MDVTPDKQNIDKVFSNTTYHIDFYQRQYKWNEEPVKRLLEDIFYKFNIEYEKFKDNDIELKKLVEKYSWYYLNTYVTNSVEGKIYIVDGQQRLTTLTLILIKLKHMSKDFQSQLENWICAKIVGHSGFEKEFWMNHEGSKDVLIDLYEGNDLKNIDTSNNITSSNLVKNYNIISNWLDRELNEKHKFESFVFYFLKRLVLINLNVEQTDVPMVFEVINDRGVRLKPYEILKGKLLGQIDKEELDQLEINDLWDCQVNKINELYEDEIDNFFMYFLRGKFANTIGDSRKFDRSYHRTMFIPEIDEKLKLQHNPRAVKDFLKNEFKYYTELYYKILKYYKEPQEDYIHVYYNHLTDMDSQFLLILSACKLNDSQEEEKIKTISYEVDRFFTLLQLQKSYDSNDFNESIYKISAKIREKDVKVIREVFNKYLISLISETRGLRIQDDFSYHLFKDTGIELNKRFKRYFFARIEYFIAKNTNMKMKHSFYDLVANTGSVNGFHIEHILAENDESLKAFGEDRERFERERNRLGGLLLLKGKDNISSNNETYSQKLKTYANTLYWNETLREDNYKSKLDFANMMSQYNLKFRPMNVFGPNELEERQKLLFDLAKIIWK
ncbi:MAG: DUF262 domain-containing protein [Tissierellia bacterium]|nr:DUF262 domain-containing protein [Tissierellia bacterium]